MQVINHIAIKILKSVGEESGKTSMDCLVKETLLECQKLGFTPDLKNVKSSVKNVMRFLFMCSVSAKGEKLTEISKAKVFTKSKKYSLRGKNRSFEDIKNYCDKRTKSNALIVSVTTESFKSLVNDNLLLESHDLNSCDFSHCLGACLVGDTSFIAIECNFLNSDAIDRLKGILSNVKTLFDSRVWVVLATSSSLNHGLLPFIEKQFDGHDHPLTKSIPEKNDVFSEVCDSANASHGKTSNQCRASEYDFEMNEEIESRVNVSNQVSEISELKEQVLKLREIINSKDRDIEVYASRLTDKDKALEEALSNLNREQLSKLQLEKECKVSELRIADYIKEVTSLKNMIEIEEDKFNELQKKHDLILLDFQTLSKELESLKLEVDAKDKRNQNLLNELQYLGSQHSTLQDEFSNLTIQINCLREESCSCKKAKYGCNSKLDDIKKLNEKLCETKTKLGNASSVQIVVDSIPKLHYKTDVSKAEDKIYAKIKILRGELIQDHSDFHEFTGIGNTLKRAKNDAFNTFINNIESYVSNMKS